MSLAHNALDEASPVAPEYQAVFRAAPSPMALVCAREGRIWIEDANPAFRELYGIERAAGWRLGEVFRGASAEQVRRASVQCLRDGVSATLRIAHDTGSEVRILEVQARRLDDLNPNRVLITVGPAPAALTLSSLGEAGVLAEIGALSRGLVYIHDIERGTFRFGEHPLLHRFGMSPGIVGVEDAVNLIEEADREVFYRAIREQVAASDGQVIESVIRLKAVDGGHVWTAARTQVFARTPDGRVRRVLGVATDETERYRHAAELAQAADALAHAEINERRRIGRELHDSAAQLLVAARLGLNKIARQQVLTEEPRATLEEAREAIENAQQEIRNFAFVLHPPLLQDQSLEEALRTFAAGFGRRTGLSIGVDAGSRRRKLPFATQVALFRVAQEALMNTYRHARAQHVTVRLGGGAGRTVLEVEDDGIGIPAPNAVEAEGVGVSGMRARMKQIGGTFDLLPGAVGALVRASVPTPSRVRPERRAALPPRLTASGQPLRVRAESA